MFYTGSMMRRFYEDLWAFYSGKYTESYCAAHDLFVAYDSKNNLVHITRPIIDYQVEVANTDMYFVTSGWQDIESDDEVAKKRIQEILEENSFEQKLRFFVLQGLIFGDTAMKVGKDDQGHVKFDVVRLRDGILDFEMQNGQITAWTYRELYQRGNQEPYVERFGIDSYERTQGDSVIARIPNVYGVPWLFHVANAPSIDYPVWGISEIKKIQGAIDEMNSTLSRISAIESIYADPHFLITGARKGNMEREQKAWFVPEGADIRILEYRGNVIPAMLEKYDRIEKNVRDKTPELILNDLGNISGYALRLKLTKLRQKISSYRQVYFTALENMFNLLYKMDSGKDVQFKIEAEDIIPEDSVALAQYLLPLMESEIISKETVTEELGFNYNEEQERIQKEAVNEYSNRVQINGQNEPESPKVVS